MVSDGFLHLFLLCFTEFWQESDEDIHRCYPVHVAALVRLLCILVGEVSVEIHLHSFDTDIERFQSHVPEVLVERDAEPVYTNLDLCHMIPA